MVRLSVLEPQVLFVPPVMSLPAANHQYKVMPFPLSWVMSPALPVIKLVEPAVGETTNVLNSQVSAEEIVYSKGKL